MKSFLLGFFIMGLGGAVSGCSEEPGCTEIGCSSTMRVSFTGVAEKYAGSLPLSFQLCTKNSSCTIAELTKENGALTCKIVTSLSTSSCTIQANGKDIAIEFGLESRDTALTEVPLSVIISVAGTTDHLFEEANKKVTLASVQPNGPGCEPTCAQGSVSFTP